MHPESEFRETSRDGRLCSQWKILGWISGIRDLIFAISEIPAVFLLWRCCRNIIARFSQSTSRNRDENRSAWKHREPSRFAHKTIVQLSEDRWCRYTYASLFKRFLGIFGYKYSERDVNLRNDERFKIYHTRKKCLIRGNTVFVLKWKRTDKFCYWKKSTLIRFRFALIGFRCTILFYIFESNTIRQALFDFTRDVFRSNNANEKQRYWVLRKIEETLIIR